jgi:hypothetical protein
MEIQSRAQLPELLKVFNLPLIGAELGIAEGRTSKVFLQGGLEKLYMIDTWRRLEQMGDASYPQGWHDNNLKEAHERVEEFGDKAIFLQGLTKDMAVHIPDESLGFVYIDANHAYEAVMEDLKTYFSKAVSGGIISGHDIGNPAYGVKRAVEEFCKDKYEIHIIPEDHVSNSSFWFIKK